MTRWKLTIEYVGTDYLGWQRQKDGPSIQQAIEEAIEAFSGQKVSINVAGRTDAGVHARGQVAHVNLEDFTRPMDGFEVAKAISAHLLDQPISILTAEVVNDDFNARHDAKNKLYTYRIINRQAAPTIDKGFCWHIKRNLDVDAMAEAGKILLGHHDFTTFRDSQCQAQSPMRTLDRLDFEVRDYNDCGGREILMHVEAKSFLHHQVRNIAGSLSFVGHGKWTKDDLKAALDAKDRTKGGPTAPAAGLYLVRIDY
ncbi:MAG: tRNA pseudouridine(38-40) synthase TruA [Pseudomonadota bacterium]